MINFAFEKHIGIYVCMFVCMYACSIKARTIKVYCKLNAPKQLTCSLQYTNIYIFMWVDRCAHKLSQVNAYERAHSH